MPRLKRRDFKIGADPEFALVGRGGEVVHASRYVEDNALQSRFGRDGGGVLMELRPEPSYDPVAVVASLRTAMRAGYAALPLAARKLEWRAGSSFRGLPLGGHIHFGTAALPGNLEPFHLDLCLALSAYSGVVTLLLEDRAQAAERRLRCGYGEVDSYRDQPHGFEWRAPGSWLTSPHVALGVLCLSKVVAWEAIYRRLRAPRGTVDNPEWLTSFRTAQTEGLRRGLPELWRRVRACELYPSHRGPIEFLRRLVAAEATWFPLATMREAWGVEPPRELRATTPPAARRAPRRADPCVA